MTQPGKLQWESVWCSGTSHSRMRIPVAGGTLLVRPPGDAQYHVKTSTSTTFPRATSESAFASSSSKKRLVQCHSHRGFKTAVIQHVKEMVDMRYKLGNATGSCRTLIERGFLHAFFSGSSCSLLRPPRTPRSTIQARSTAQSRIIPAPLFPERLSRSPIQERER